MNNFYKSYINGNYKVYLLNDGTKIRHSEYNVLIPDRVESMDVTITEKCNMGCPFCFVPGTNVLTDKGNIPIENIQINDKVISFNNTTYNTELKNVDQLHKNMYNGDMIVIEIDDNHIIKCTPNHLIYTLNRGYIEASKLQLDDDILLL